MLYPDELIPQEVVQEYRFLAFSFQLSLFLILELGSPRQS